MYHQIHRRPSRARPYLVVVPALISPPLGEAGTSILQGVILDVLLTAAVIVTTLCLHADDDVGAR